MIGQIKKPRLPKDLVLTYKDFPSVDVLGCVSLVLPRDGINFSSGSIRLPEKALHLLAEYQKIRSKKKIEDEYVFPELRGFEGLTDTIALQNQIRYRLFNLDAALKAIGKELDFKVKLTMHIARHSFATISGGKIPIQILQQLYRHSDINVTVDYMKAFVTDGTDRTLEKVLEY